MTLLPRFALSHAPALLLTTTLTAAAPAAVIHVEADGSGDYPTIQAAIDAAVAGDVVELGPGDYTGNVSRVIEGNIANAVAHLKSGVTLQSANGPALTRIDGEGSRHCLVGQFLDPSTVVRGISFIYGYASGGGGNGAWGGGVLVIDSAPTFEGNRFRDCYALGGGGFLSRRDFGGVGPTMLGNLFLDNTAGDLGGGLEISFAASCVVEGNTFVRNHTFSQGGAGLLINASAGTVDRNLFWTNVATGGAGGVTFISGAGASSTGSCNVFWNNQGDGDPNVTGGGIVIGANDNIIADPLFCDPGKGDFHVSTISPCAPTAPSGCGLIGALGVGCGPVGVEETTWGELKAAYR